MSKQPQTIEITIFVLVLTLWVAIWLNTASDHVPLKYYSVIEHLPYSLKPGLSLKWLPQGTTPFLFSKKIIAFLYHVFANFFVADTSCNLVYHHPLFIILLGFTTCILRSITYVGTSPEEVRKQMSRLGVRIPGVKPGFETLKYLERRIFWTSIKGGVIFGLLVYFSKLLDVQLLKITTFNFCLTNIFLVSDLLIQTLQQINALKQEQEIKNKFLS